MNKSVFAYRNGMLCVEAIPLEEIAQDVDTPFYCLSAKQLRRNYRLFLAPFEGQKVSVFYNVRTNANLALLNILNESGAGIDVASAGELEKALEAGVPVEKIMFSGACLSRDDIACALLAGVMQLSVGSLSEIRLVREVAGMFGRKANVSLLVQADDCAPSIARFGFDIDEVGEGLAEILASDTLSFRGLSVHLPSRNKDYSPLEKACDKLALLVGLLRAQGFDVPQILVSGGGLLPGLNADQPPFADYARVIQDKLVPSGCAIALSVGRRIVGDACILVGKVVHRREKSGQKMLLIDAGMNDLMHMALFGVNHEIVAVRDDGHGTDTETVSVSGPLYDIADFFGSQHAMPHLDVGDLVAIMNVGAYGSSLSSGANGHALIPEVLVSGAQYAVVRRRVSVSEQTGWEMIPDWMVISRAA